MRIDTRASSHPLLRRLRRLRPGERREEALAFVRQFHRELGLPEAARRKREREVRRALRSRGSYEHTTEEIAFGARVAWRNHTRCIGRRLWPTLKVLDCRDVTDADEIATRICDHMQYAFGDGRIRSVISIFPPAVDEGLPSWIESPQVLQYAGYLDEQGHVVGDARNVEWTRIVRSLGWKPPEPLGRFDLLPLVLRDAQDRRRLYEIPLEAAPEVRLTHPECPEFDALGLRWYALPCVTDMILTIGGIDYPCAPFSGFYMGTEIASRNLADERRYDLLPEVARAFGEDPEAPGPPLWKDRALLELNRAVLHSFSESGVTIVDHHTASGQYMDFAASEHASGREPFSDWKWIVPPQASPACPVFHLEMTDVQEVPNFYRSRTTDGDALGAWRTNERETRLERRWRRLRKRYRDWRRRRN